MSIQCTWGNHVFTVYPPTALWNNVAGIYIFCRVTPQNMWAPLYIGKADSFRTRFQDHERGVEAGELGASHIHAMAVPLAADRDRIEQELIRAYHPTLNVQHRLRPPI